MQSRENIQNDPNFHAPQPRMDLKDKFDHWLDQTPTRRDLWIVAGASLVIGGISGYRLGKANILDIAQTTLPEDIDDSILDVTLNGKEFGVSLNYDQYFYDEPFEDEPDEEAYRLSDMAEVKQFLTGNPDLEISNIAYDEHFDFSIMAMTTFDNEMESGLTIFNRLWHESGFMEKYGQHNPALTAQRIQTESFLSFPTHFRSDYGKNGIRAWDIGEIIGPTEVGIYDFIAIPRSEFGDDVLIDIGFKGFDGNYEPLRDVPHVYVADIGKYEYFDGQPALEEGRYSIVRIKKYLSEEYLQSEKDIVETSAEDIRLILLDPQTNTLYYNDIHLEPYKIPLNS